MANGCKDVLFARGSGQSDDSDIWDDTALIKAYDKAVASFKMALRGEEDTTSPTKDQPAKKRKNNKRNVSRKKSNTAAENEWQVGDSCCAYWSEDGNLYAATITSIDKEKATCIILFTGYGNEEEQNLQDLLTESAEVEEAPCKVKEAESSTEESDRSPAPHSHGKTPRPKPKSNPAKGSPLWGQRFPPGPPPMPGSRLGDSRQHGPTGPAPPGWPSLLTCGPPMIPPPPPMSPDGDDDDGALGSMLIAWYMSGYHTGYYQGLKQGRKLAASESKAHPK
ncbi:hypothetical protein DPEC_G00125590 [Dallia pectoralis]|uniref:Uncharacterized protein n=1 Tax=Dallia pectoralis TaxID=75939 RepID=A0ACC2GRD6_DALPE|nr:hypothetical protein DPEC_G00125590 [Dallia pectoralis]